MALETRRSYDDVVQVLRDRLGDDVEHAETRWDQLYVRVPAERRPDALRALKSMGFTYYSYCGGVDYPDDERIDVVDNVYSYQDNQRVIVRCSAPRNAPRVPTATGVYQGADWHERETWELFGVTFVGHPRLRRLLLADWQEGFPMRKDEELQARVEKPWPGDWFSG